MVLRGYAGTYAGPPYLSAGNASMKAAYLAGPGFAFQSVPPET